MFVLSRCLVFRFDSVAVEQLANLVGDGFVLSSFARVGIWGLHLILVLSDLLLELFDLFPQLLFAHFDNNAFVVAAVRTEDTLGFGWMIFPWLSFMIFKMFEVIARQTSRMLSWLRGLTDVIYKLGKCHLALRFDIRLFLTKKEGSSDRHWLSIRLVAWAWGSKCLWLSLRHSSLGM